MSLPALNCDIIENCFIQAPLVINKEICNRSPSWKRHWWDMVPQGNYRWGEGHSKTKYTFRGGAVPQDLKWVPVEAERAPGTLGPGDLGHDPCDYRTHLVTYGLDAVNYGAFRTHTSTNRFCLDSLLHKHNFLEQWRMMVEAFANTTVGIYEKAHKLFYLMFCDIYVATPDPTTFTATKFMPTQLGQLPSIAGLEVTALSMDHLRWFYRHMMHDVPQYGISTTHGLPDYLLSTSPETIDVLYDQSPESFDVLKRHTTNMLLEGFGFEYTREHFAMAGDMDATRFNETFPGSGVLAEVFREVAMSGICGSLPFASEDYAWNSEFEISIVGLAPGSVVQANIPVPVGMMPGNADWSTRSYVGNYQFVRPPADCGNEKRNVGWWFNEFFVEPEPGCARGKAIIHRRCIPTRFDLGDCDPCPVAPCPEVLPCQPAVLVVGGQPTQLTIDLDQAIPAIIPGPLPLGYLISFTLQNGDVEAAVVVAFGADPVHTFAFNVDATQFAFAGTNCIVASTDPGLPTCGTVCACDDTVGTADQLQVEFTEGVIWLGAGGVPTVTFVDTTTTTATIISVGFNPNIGPTYLLDFGGARLCTDNGGIATVGTCP